MVKRILCIAGSDSISGGGLQADIRTYETYGIKSLNVVTCIVTIEPTTENVNVYEIPSDILKTQFDSFFNKKHELAAIKIGMLADLRIAKIVAEYLRKLRDIPIVLDPVLALKENQHETKSDIISFFKKELLPLATIVTPNLREAELLSGLDSIDSVEQLKIAAKKIREIGAKNVVIKGGQRLNGDEAIDVFFDGENYTFLNEKKIMNVYNNGAGCTFASAITSNIVKGVPLRESVINAKQFVYQAILDGIPLLDGLGNVYQGKNQ